MIVHRQYFFCNSDAAWNNVDFMVTAQCAWEQASFAFVPETEAKLCLSSGYARGEDRAGPEAGEGRQSL